MIYYLAMRKHRYTMNTYLALWEQDLADRIQVLAYESLPARTALPAGTYVFSDLERLTPSEMTMARRVAEELEAAREGIRILNDPRRVLLRFDLLRELHERGLNDFAAYRLEDADQARLPAFIRLEHTHGGSLTPPLRTARELSAAVERLIAQGNDPGRLLVVEFCDTADEHGVYRKYSAFTVGERVIPRHEIFGTDWVMKVPALGDATLLAEEEAYVRANPHAGWLRDVFAIAGIDYGRIDYGLKNGRPQVWEINTNPMILLARRRYERRHLPQQERFARELAPALVAIDAGSIPARQIPISIEAPEPRPRRNPLGQLVHRLRRRVARRRRRH